MGKKSKGKKGNSIYKTYTAGAMLTPDCHEGFTQVYKNLFVGRATDITDIIGEVDVLVPLDKVDGKIWEYDWNGDIYYVPIKDYSTLPKNIEKIKVKYVLSKLKAGKRVAIFCLGGHGRTGYFASMVLGKLGVEDPIKLLRETYCKDAVETSTQVKAIADFLNKPELIKKYPCHQFFDDYDDDWVARYYAKAKATSTSTNNGECCGECMGFKNNYGLKEWGYCATCGKTVKKSDKPCGLFDYNL